MKRRESCPMNKKIKTEAVDHLFEAILTLKTPEECYNFLMDLCTVPELNAMEQRFEVAQLLNQGMIYNKILELTGASSATISRVRRAMLDNGAGGVMQDVIIREGLGEPKADPEP